MFHDKQSNAKDNNQRKRFFFLTPQWYFLNATHCHQFYHWVGRVRAPIHCLPWIGQLVPLLMSTVFFPWGESGKLFLLYEHFASQVLVSQQQPQHRWVAYHVAIFIFSLLELWCKITEHGLPQSLKNESSRDYIVIWGL